jgi:hypothetical protein
MNFEGNLMSKAYCQNCGQSFPTSMKYCSKCGSSNVNSSKPQLKQPDRVYSPNPDNNLSLNNFNSSYQNSYVNYKDNSSSSSMITFVSETITSVVSFISFIIFILVPVGALTIYPTYNENVSNNCSALETRVISVIAHQNKSTQNDMTFNIFGGRLLAELSNGSMASAYIKELYPEIPPSIACTLEYWRVLVDNNHAKQLLSQLKK